MSTKLERGELNRLFIQEILHGKLQSARELYYKGASPNAADKNGRTVLMIAAEQNRADIIDFLVEKGAFLGDETVGGETALSIAHKWDRTDAIAVLELAPYRFGTIY